MERIIRRRVASPRCPVPSHGYPRGGLHGRIVHAFGRGIVSGEIRPGERLPTPARVRAGRGVVREAVKVLAAKGLVVSRPKTGTRVRPPEAWNLLDPDVLAWRQEGLPRGAFLEKLTDVRLIIEPGAAELAARRAAPAQVETLRVALRDMSDALDLSPPDHEAYNDADIRFHSAIVQACDNDVLEQIGAIVNTTLLVAFNAGDSRSRPGPGAPCRGTRRSSMPSAAANRTEPGPRCVDSCRTRVAPSEE